MIKWNKKNDENCICINIENSKLIKFTPKQYLEAKTIGKELIAGNTIIIDLSNISKEDALRLIDFVTGILLVTNGKYKKLANKTYLLAPKQVLLDKYLAKIAED